MKIAIVGAGAMGSLFGGLLAEAGQDVWLLDVWPEHVETINRQGLSIERQGQVRTIKAQATTDPGRIGPADLVIVFVKSTQTAAAAVTARDLIGEAGVVLTLQNGLGNADVIAEVVDPRNVLAGTTSHGATLLGPGVIRHAGIGATVIGAWSSRDQSSARRAAEVMTRAGISTQVAEDVKVLIWEKFLINVGINAITALCGVKNGQLLDLEVTRDLMRLAVEEAVAVAKAQGIPIKDGAVERVYQVAAATGANRSSMGQDVDKRRQTEIAVINGAVVREAGRVGIPVPVNRTLTALIETLQAHYQ
ncbi:MAG: 2-dehydropantoate 2-reductase [Thermodesulfobacteriota bacterium]